MASTTVILPLIILLYIVGEYGISHSRVVNPKTIGVGGANSLGGAGVGGANSLDGAAVGGANSLNGAGLGGANSLDNAEVGVANQRTLRMKRSLAERYYTWLYNCRCEEIELEQWLWELEKHMHKCKPGKAWVCDE